MRFLTILSTYFLLSLNVSVAMENSSDEEENYQNIRWANTSKKSDKASETRPNKKRKTANQADDISYFQNTLEGIKEQIQEGHDRLKPNWKGICYAYKAFNELEFHKSLWKTYSDTVNAYRWPSQQNWKDVVGGHLFFPSETLEWESIPVESYHLRRIDYLWVFAIGAKFNHSLAKFYLAKMLNKIRDEYTDAKRPKFFHKLFQEAYADLSQCSDNSDACYVIGRNYGEYPYLSSRYMPREEKSEGLRKTEEALRWHTKGNDLRNKFRILHIKKCAPAIFDPPAVAEYLVLARGGYSPAYSKAALLIKDYTKRKEIRKEAIEKGYTIARLGLGSMYEVKGKLDKARKCYKEAGQAGITSGYIHLGISYVDDVQCERTMKKKPLIGRTKEDIKKSIKAFERAGKGGNPEGWEYLARLYCQLNEEKLISQKEYKDKILDTLREGTWLGSAACYHMAYFRLADEIFAGILKYYGNPPQHELRYDIEKFLK